ncbi:MAG TPA: amino acid permease [Nitrososphaeraceae archaeon]|nr:amino acid permease [Nitrososphaeraceae archaeon]
MAEYRSNANDISEVSLPANLHQRQLVRTLGLLDVVMIGIAGMIGGAIFVLVGPAIGLAGSAVIIAFIINGIITLFTAMGYAELGSAMPEAGGGYLWVREGLPRPNAFISGWMAWFAHIVAGSLYAVGYGSFQFSLLQILGIIGDQPLLGIIHLDKLIAVASIAAFTYVNVKGASQTSKLGIIVTVIQLGTIFALIGAGFLTISNNPEWNSNILSNFAPIGIAGIVAAMGLTFIAFEGYEIIVQTGEEIKNPKKNIPRAIFISLTLVVLLYCLVAFVSIGAIFPQNIGDIPAWKFIGQNGDLGISKAAELFLPYGFFIILAGGIVSSLAALNATTYSSARVAFAMGRHYNLPYQLSEIHHKFKTPYVATIISGILMAVVAYALPLDQIALAAGVIFLLLFTQVNISVITIRKMYGDKLHYGFKTPFFPFVPIIGVIVKLGLAIYLLITQPFSWVISVLWIAIGFAVYRIYSFRKEIDHYAPIITSEGDLTRKDFRILIPYTPENPDRLIKYAIRVAKENDGEINILRVITVPHQTPLSAGIAFTESAARAFEPLEKIIDKENILNHYFVRISHDSTEALLSTIEEQRIDLLITDYETLRRNKALQTLLTCNILAVLTGGGSDEELILEEFIAKEEKREEANPISETNRKNMVVLYDGGDHSDMVLKTASWLEHSGRFKVIVLSIKKKEEREHIGYSKIDNEDIKNKKELEKEQHVQYLEQIGVEFHEVFVSEKTQNNSEKFANLILSSINASQPDLVIMGKRVGKFNVFDNQDFVSMLDGLNCPVIVARSFIIPGVSRIKSALLRAIHRY